MENKKEEIFYFDIDDKIIPSKEGAVKIIINEYDDNGELLQSTTLFKSDK